jgi:hypothetical protein
LLISQVWKVYKSGDWVTVFEFGPQTTFIVRVGLEWQTFPKVVHDVILNVIVWTKAVVSRSRDNIVDDAYVALA